VLHELRISKMEGMLARARVISNDQFSSSEIHILSKVKIKNVKTGKEYAYTLVSAEEADFSQNKLAVTSLIGKGLLAKHVGDVVQIQVPAGMQEFEILEIV